MYWNSGHMNELPAYAASTCNHRLFFSQIGPTSSRRSNEQQDVVPKVVETKNGIKPFLVSSWMILLRVSPVWKKGEKTVNYLNSYLHHVLIYHKDSHHLNHY